MSEGQSPEDMMEAALREIAARRDRAKAVLTQLRQDCRYHESYEDNPAELRNKRGWKNVEDYVNEALEALDGTN
jgi:hypothetical protein